MTVHLRLHHPVRYGKATKLKPGSDRTVRVYYTSRPLHRRGIHYVPMKVVRIATCACDEGLRRFESTARLSDHLAAERTVTCERCLILLDQLLELGVTRKPLTERRLRAMKKENRPTARDRQR